MIELSKIHSENIKCSQKSSRLLTSSSSTCNRCNTNKYTHIDRSLKRQRRASACKADGSRQRIPRGCRFESCTNLRVPVTLLSRIYPPLPFREYHPRPSCVHLLIRPKKNPQRERFTTSYFYSKIIIDYVELDREKRKIRDQVAT
ncbi:hypothetical protein ANTPLA_LOCUS10337 [Anthophora plagiata]